MDKFAKMLEKKKKMGREMSDVEQEAKMNVIKDLRDEASSKMGEKLGNLKKVAVMSDSKEGLEKGLDKAKEMMANMPEGHMEEESDAHEGKETPEEEALEGHEDMENMSEEELDAKLQELMALKEKMKSSKQMG